MIIALFQASICISVNGAQEGTEFLAGLLRTVKRGTPNREDMLFSGHQLRWESSNGDLGYSNDPAYDPNFDPKAAQTDHKRRAVRAR